MRPKPLALLSLTLLSAGCSTAPGTPLAIAARNGNAGEVRRLLAAGADPDAPVSGADLTPLAFAVRHGREEAATVLLDAGADPEMPSGVNGWTPLVHATHESQETMVELLVTRSRPSEESLSAALDLAAGYGLPASVRRLLAAGAVPGRDALSSAVGGAWDIDARWNGCGPHTETVRALLSAAPDLTVPDTWTGRSALRFARKKGCTELLDLLEAPRRASNAR